MPGMAFADTRNVERNKVIAIRPSAWRDASAGAHLCLGLSPRGRCDSRRPARSARHAIITSATHTRSGNLGAVQVRDGVRRRACEATRSLSARQRRSPATWVTLRLHRHTQNAIGRRAGRSRHRALLIEQRAPGDFGILIPSDDSRGVSALTRSRRRPVHGAFPRLVKRWTNRPKSRLDAATTPDQSRSDLRPRRRG